MELKELYIAKIISYMLFGSLFGDKVITTEVKHRG